MKKFVYLLIYLSFGFNLILSSWSVLHHDIYFDTDVAKDFLIMDEITHKKIVLIGPRADFQGLFHGTIWHYFNLPVYMLGHGNPEIQGWFWIFLVLLFIAGNYYFIRKIFDKKSALIATVFLSFYLVLYTQSFSNGPASIFVMPFCLYFFTLYIISGDWRYLALHIICIGILIHLLLAVGIPLLLSLVGANYWIIRKKKYRHLFFWLIIILFFLPFLLFDLRHNFIQLRSAWQYLHGARNENSPPFIMSINDRLTTLMSSGINFFKFGLTRWNYVIFLFFTYAYWRILRTKNKKANIYSIFLFFYFGYYLLSLFHGGLMLPTWWLSVSLLAVIVFSTLHLYTPKKLYYSLLIIILTVSFYQNIVFIRERSAAFGKAMNSWRFRLTIAKTVYADAPGEFGYFIYSPDFFGYQDKHALLYAGKLFSKKADRFEKKPISYVVVEPVPANRQQFHNILVLNPDWWIYNQFQIRVKPVKTIFLGQGYRINKYELSSKELLPTSQITTDQWFYFR